MYFHMSCVRIKITCEVNVVCYSFVARFVTKHPGFSTKTAYIAKRMLVFCVICLLSLSRFGWSSCFVTVGRVLNLAGKLSVITEVFRGFLQPIEVNI
jgi:hypothetical protein